MFNIFYFLKHLPAKSCWVTLSESPWSNKRILHCTQSTFYSQIPLSKFEVKPEYTPSSHNKSHFHSCSAPRSHPSYIIFLPSLQNRLFLLPPRTTSRPISSLTSQAGIGPRGYHPCAPLVPLIKVEVHHQTDKLEVVYYTIPVYVCKLDQIIHLGGLSLRN